MSHSKFGLLPWRSRSQHDLSAKSCPAHNLVIWSQISQLFYIIDHHIDTTVERTRTLLFAVEFYNYFWQTTSLCPIPIRGALPGSTGSCVINILVCDIYTRVCHMLMHFNIWHLYWLELDLYWICVYVNIVITMFIYLKDKPMVSFKTIQHNLC